MLRLITNNAGLITKVTSAQLIAGTSLEVLYQVRCLVHSGSIILTHPLCGSLRPNHQPYRSIILDILAGPAELLSLTLIESAIHVYEASPSIAPCSLNDGTLLDYAYIDYELMRESLVQYGMLKGGALIPAPMQMKKEE